MDAVVVEGLDVTRGGRPVLQDLALRVPEGRVTGLLGPSRPVTLPAGTRRDRSRSTGRPPRVTSSPSTTTASIAFASEASNHYQLMSRR